MLKKKNIIEVNKLTKTYHVRGTGVRDYSGEVKAVRGVSFEVARGEFFGFLGPNGAGKTTTINMLVNLVKKTSGSVKIDNLEVSEHESAIHSKVGFAMQEVGLDEMATAREMLELHGHLYHVLTATLKERISYLLKLVELEKVADRYVSTYSGGMRRRFDLALALIHEPAVLFLDEPTTGLDPHARQLIWGHLRDLNKKGMTIFLTTHFMEEAETLCSRLCIMDKGKIVASGSPAQLVKKYRAKNLEGVFLKTTGHNLGEEQVNPNAADPYTRLRSRR